MVDTRVIFFLIKWLVISLRDFLDFTISETWPMAFRAYFQHSCSIDFVDGRKDDDIFLGWRKDYEICEIFFWGGKTDDLTLTNIREIFFSREKRVI